MWTVAHRQERREKRGDGDWSCEVREREARSRGCDPRPIESLIHIRMCPIKFYLSRTRPSPFVGYPLSPSLNRSPIRLVITSGTIVRGNHDGASPPAGPAHHHCRNKLALAVAREQICLQHFCMNPPPNALKSGKRKEEKGEIRWGSAAVVPSPGGRDNYISILILCMLSKLARACADETRVPNGRHWSDLCPSYMYAHDFKGLGLIFPTPTPNN